MDNLTRRRLLLERLAERPLEDIDFSPQFNDFPAQSVLPVGRCHGSIT
jgi:hypothetical protein